MAGRKNKYDVDSVVFGIRIPSDERAEMFKKEIKNLVKKLYNESNSRTTKGRRVYKQQ